MSCSSRNAPRVRIRCSRKCKEAIWGLPCCPWIAISLKFEAWWWKRIKWQEKEERVQILSTRQLSKRNLSSPAPMNSLKSQPNSEKPSVFWISSRTLSSIIVHWGLPLCESKNQFYFVLPDKNTLWYYYLLRWIFTITSTTPGSFSTLFYKKSN